MASKKLHTDVTIEELIRKTKISYDATGYAIQLAIRNKWAEKDINDLVDKRRKLEGKLEELLKTANAL